MDPSFPFFLKPLPKEKKVHSGSGLMEIQDACMETLTLRERESVRERHRHRERERGKRQRPEWIGSKASILFDDGDRWASPGWGTVWETNGNPNRSPSRRFVSLRTEDRVFGRNAGGERSPLRLFFFFWVSFDGIVGTIMMIERKTFRSAFRFRRFNVRFRARYKRDTIEEYRCTFVSLPCDGVEERF